MRPKVNSCLLHLFWHLLCVPGNKAFINTCRQSEKHLLAELKCVPSNAGLNFFVNLSDSDKALWLWKDKILAIWYHCLWRPHDSWHIRYQSHLGKNFNNESTVDSFITNSLGPWKICSLWPWHCYSREVLWIQ
jgi:hypothetical protein